MLERAKDAYVEHLIAEENFGRNLLEGYCNSRGTHLFICFFPVVKLFVLPHDSNCYNQSKWYDVH